MFNNLIQRKFDFAGLGGTYTPLKPIFNPTVGYALHHVIKPLLAIASEKRLYEPDEIAVKNFRMYFLEATETLETGLAKDLSRLATLSFEKECGVRLACFIEWARRDYTSPYTSRSYKKNFLIDQVIMPITTSWLDNPRQDSAAWGIFDNIVVFNAKLDDTLGRLFMGNEDN